MKIGKPNLFITNNITCRLSTVFITGLVVVSCNWPSVWANQERSLEVGKQISHILELEADKKIPEAYVASGVVVRKIYESLHLDSALFSTRHRLERRYQEKIIHQNLSSESFRGTQESSEHRTIYYPSLGESVSIGGNRDYFNGSYSQKTWNRQSELIYKNPNDEIDFRSRAKDEKKSLQKQIFEYFNNHALEIAEMKWGAIEAMQLAFQMETDPELAQLINLDELSEIRWLASDLRAYAEQDLIVCVKKKLISYSASGYESTRDGKKESTRPSRMEKSDGFSHLFEETKEFAHTVVDCDSTTDRVPGSQKDSQWAVNFSMLDRIMDGWWKAVARAAVFSGIGVEIKPTFGNPYLSGS